MHRSWIQVVRALVAQTTTFVQLWIPDWDDTLLMGPNHNVRTVVGQAIGQQKLTLLAIGGMTLSQFK
ncbi:hypothetical protein [Wolbachia endosymbiont of Drosophila tsacasi]|uniref:hypothetical protein n=1 Tax=Wolbachia endosymbiont of Drosophila tsacasi TaxID=3002579 RepID=UPI0023A9DEA4|nr:hypothetical protein [Wolbachia endosymbiont of Drosophila tsacasi]MDE5061743.1 hypothetical protein [Wolbachia endosymbiont of Drosophila tsacasi]